LAQGMIMINRDRKPSINRQVRIIISFFSSIRML